ncbi:MAG: sugar transferase, partial [Hyphomicrobiaceae bacterium]
QLDPAQRGAPRPDGPRPPARAPADPSGAPADRAATRPPATPGLPGLAQIEGCRGGTETQDKIERRLALDLQYVSSWSLWLDLRILALTVLRGLGGKNAY